MTSRMMRSDSQRHVDDGGDTAGGGGEGGRGKSFPMSPSRIVDVDMGIH